MFKVKSVSFVVGSALAVVFNVISNIELSLDIEESTINGLLSGQQTSA